MVGMGIALQRLDQYDLVTSHYKSISVFQSCLSTLEFLLLVNQPEDKVNPLASDQPKFTKRRQQLIEKRQEFALKMLALIFMNISRALELKGHCYFAEVAARACFFNMEDSGFQEWDEMVDYVGHFYNFIKEKVAKFHQYIAYVDKQEEFADVLYGEKAPMTNAAGEIQNKALRMSFQLQGFKSTSEDLLLINKKQKIQNFDFHQIELMIDRYMLEKLNQLISSHFIHLSELPNKPKYFNDRESNHSISSSALSIKNGSKRPNYVSNSTRNNSLNNSIVNKSGHGEHNHFFQIKSKNTLVDLKDQLNISKNNSPNTSQVILKFKRDSNIEDIKNKSLSKLKDYESPLAKSLISITRKEKENANKSLNDSKVGAFLLNHSAEKSRKTNMNNSMNESKGEILKGFLSKMFLGENPAMLMKEKDEEKKKQRRVKSALGTVLGLSLPEEILSDDRKEKIAALDISQKFTNTKALQGIPARVYLEENNFKGMSRDTLGLLVKRSCQDTKFNSLEKAKNKLDHIKNITFYDERNVRFIKKSIRNRMRAGVVNKAYDLVNDEKYTIKLDEEYKRKVYDEQMLKEMKKAEAEKAALDMLAGKKEEEPVALTPAKKLQAIIFEHRYVHFLNTGTQLTKGICLLEIS